MSNINKKSLKINGKFYDFIVVGKIIDNDNKINMQFLKMGDDENYRNKKNVTCKFDEKMFIPIFNGISEPSKTILIQKVNGLAVPVQLEYEVQQVKPVKPLIPTNI